MKNQKIAEILAIGLFTMIGAQAIAQEVKGGGQGTLQNGKLVLMDTVEGLTQTSRCTWVPMSQVLNQYNISNEVLTKLSGIHAYAAHAFKSEAERINVCFGGKLRPLANRSSDNRVFVRVNLKLQTIAYRWGQKVLIDTDKLSQLSEADQAMLLIHEIAHSFLSMDPNQSGGRLSVNDTPPPTIFEAVDNSVFSRRDRLWSFVNAIYRNYKTGISREEFKLAITMNGANLPDSDAFWQKNPANYSLALNRTADKKERIVAISKLDWLEAKANLLATDSTEIEFFLNTWYSPAIQILTQLPIGWDQELRNQIETYGLDPLQVLPNNESLITIAIQQQNADAVRLLISYPSYSNDRQIRVRFFKAILSGKLIVDNLEEILSKINPNEGELTRTIENGIQIYHGEVPFFVLSIVANRMDIAQYFINSGKVTLKTMAMGIDSLVKLDMGITHYAETTPAQDQHRALLTSILNQQGFTPRPEALLSALRSKNEYASMLLLDSVVPTAFELSQLAQSPWALEFNGGIQVLRKALNKAGALINSADVSGKRMIDYAVANRSTQLFDILIQAGANQFRRSSLENEKDWIMGRLIENDNAQALTAYMTQTQYQNQMDLYRQLDLAKIRLKKNAETAIQAQINQ